MQEFDEICAELCYCLLRHVANSNVNHEEIDLETKTIRVSHRAYRALKMAEAAAKQRSLCYLASEAILASYQQSVEQREPVTDNLPVAAQSTEAVAEFYRFYKEFMAAAQGVTQFPDLDLEGLTALFGPRIESCFKMLGGFELFFEQLAASPYLVKNGTLNYLLKPENYRRVCGGSYAPRTNDNVGDKKDSDTLAYQLAKEEDESWEI